MTSDTAGAPVQAIDDGIVVKVEEDEKDFIDALNIGRCGRYVVVKHSYPNGNAVFTRYAQLGRIGGSDGRPIVAGMRVKKQDKIGEVGSSKILHFEVRPVVPGAMEQNVAWTARYGADPAMEWSRYQAVDPQAFDVDTFGGRAGGQMKSNGYLAAGLLSRLPSVVVLLFAGLGLAPAYSQAPGGAWIRQSTRASRRPTCAANGNGRARASRARSALPRSSRPN